MLQCPSLQPSALSLHSVSPLCAPFRDLKNPGVARTRVSSLTLSTALPTVSDLPGHAQSHCQPKWFAQVSPVDDFWSPSLSSLFGLIFLPWALSSISLGGQSLNRMNRTDTLSYIWRWAQNDRTLYFSALYLLLQSLTVTGFLTIDKVIWANVLKRWMCYPSWKCLYFNKQFLAMSKF